MITMIFSVIHHAFGPFPLSWYTFLSFFKAWGRIDLCANARWMKDFS